MEALGRAARYQAPCNIVGHRSSRISRARRGHLQHDLPLYSLRGDTVSSLDDHPCCSTATPVAVSMTLPRSQRRGHSTRTLAVPAASVAASNGARVRPVATSATAAAAVADSVLLTSSSPAGMLDAPDTNAAARVELRGMTLEQLTTWVQSLGDANPERRATQLWRYLYSPRHGWPTGFESRTSTHESTSTPPGTSSGGDLTGAHSASSAHESCSKDPSSDSSSVTSTSSARGAISSSDIGASSAVSLSNASSDERASSVHGGAINAPSTSSVPNTSSVSSTSSASRGSSSSRGTGSPQFAAAFVDLAHRAGASLSTGLLPPSVVMAGDGTRKLLFSLDPTAGPGKGSVETVLIPMHKPGSSAPRYTVCVSSQVGCAMNCQFCYTGRMGLLGHLTAAQIVGQVMEAKRQMSGLSDPPSQINNIVFMGMGEPFDNYAAVAAAVDILATGLGFSRSKIIVSTVGLVPQIRSFVAARTAKLAVSLHATTDEVRNAIVPVNRRYPLAELIGALRELFPINYKRSDDFVVIEYVLLGGVNDSLEDAHRLSQLLSDVYCMINLIVFNPHDGTPFVQSPPESVSSFRSVLIAAGKVCTVRLSKGDDTMAACGQLGGGPAAARNSRNGQSNVLATAPAPVEDLVAIA